MAMRSVVSGYLAVMLLPAVGLPAGAGDGGTITIPMKPGKASRPGHISVTIGKDQKPVITPATDTSLTRQGEIKVDGETFRLYLPAAKAYSTRNTGTGDGQFENTSTLLSIDADHDGRLTEEEGWFVSLPVRVGDRMFEVARIAPDGSALTLKPSSAPLSGVIVGRRCPPFSYKTRDGKTFTQDTYRGKALLLDVWSVT